MYKIYIKNLTDASDTLIYQSDNKSTNLIKDPKLSFEWQQPGSLEFSMLPGHPSYNNIHSMITFVTAYWDDEELFYGRVLTVDKSLDGQKDVYCEGALSFLADGEVHSYDGTTTAQAFFSKCVTDYNATVEARKQFTVGTCEFTDSGIYFKMEDNSEAKSTIDDQLVKRLGGCLVVRKTTNGHAIDYLKQIGLTSTQKIRICENVQDRTEHDSGESVFTVLRPIGANDPDAKEPVKLSGSGVIEIPEMIAKYGRIIKTENFSDQTTEAGLRTEAEKFITRLGMSTDKLPATVDFSFVDFHYLNPSIGRIHFGDVFSDIEGYEGEAMTVGALELDLENPANDNLSLYNKTYLDASEYSALLNTATGSSSRSGGGRGSSLAKTLSSLEETEEDKFWKHVHATDDALMLFGDRIQLAADLLIGSTREYDVLASDVEELYGTHLHGNGNGFWEMYGKIYKDEDGNISIKDGAGLRVERTIDGVMASFGVYDEQTLTAGIMVDKLNDDDTTYILGDRIAIGNVTTSYHVALVTGSDVSNYSSINPHQLRYLELVNGQYVYSEDTVAKPNKTYYVKKVELPADGSGSSLNAALSEMKLDFTSADSDIRAHIYATNSEIRSEISNSSSTLYSSIAQTASNIRVELADTEQNLYNYINLTASGIRQQITNAGNRTIVNDTDPRGETYTPKEGDIWIESVHDGTWDGADGFDWEHDEDYDWTQVQGAKVWTWKNNQWQLVADRQQLVTYSDFINTTDILISQKIAELANEEGQVEVYRSLIEQSAENIRAEVYGATSDIYSYIHQTASSVSVAAGQRPTTVVQNSHTDGEPTSINGRGLKENDIWIDTADQTSWDEALNFNWNDDVEYNWNELRSDKIYVYRNGAWHLALDGTVLTEDTDLKVESDRISLLARNIDTLDGYARENFAQLQVRANEIYAEVLDKTNNLGSRITQTASNILLHVENEISDMGATLEVTAQEIRSSVWSTQSSVYSSIVQTSSRIMSTVRDTKLELQSSIDQTASQIALKVSKGDVGTQLAVDVGNVSITNGNLVVDGYVTAAELNAETAKFNNLVSGSTQAAKIWAVDIKANNVEIGSGTSGTLKYHGTNVTTRNALSADGTKKFQVLGLGLDDTDSGLDALSGAFNGCNINANGGQIKFTFYKLGGGYVERNFNIADTAYYQNAVSARRIDNIIAARLTTPTYDASTGNISANFRLTAQNGTGDDVTSLGSYDKTLNMSGASAYSAGQDSMGVALDTDNNTVIVTESATKSMSVTAAAGISYSAVSHQYTAAAGAKVNGTTLASATKVSGTEAYEAGIADAEAYITQNGGWASGDWYVYPGDDYSFYPATFVGGDFKINYNRGIRIIAQGGGGTTINVQEARHASGTFAYNMNIKVKVNGTVYTVQSQPLSPSDWVAY